MNSLCFVAYCDLIFVLLDILQNTILLKTKIFNKLSESSRQFRYETDILSRLNLKQNL